MEVNEKLQKILGNICDNTWELVCPEERPPDEYIVYNSVLDVPEDFGDNHPQEWVHHMQIHLYTAGSYRKLKESVRNALKESGFAVDGIERMYDRESGYFHVCFSCSIQEEREEWIWQKKD